MRKASALFLVLLFFVLSVCSAASLRDPSRTQGNKRFQYEAQAVLSEDNELADVTSMNIERYRKGDMNLRLLDENQKPLADANVEIRQVQHDFLFGCSYPLEKDLPQDTAKFQELFSSVFNYLSTENHFKWTILEPRQGEIDWRQIDRLLLWAQSQGIKVKGHTLVWGDWPGIGSGVPPWVREREWSRNEIRQLLERRIKDVVGRYAGRVMAWDVVNEPIHTKWFDEHFGSEYIDFSLKWAKDTDPKSILLVNEYHILTDESDMEAYVALLNRLKSSNAPLDVIGLQEHQGSIWLSPDKIYEKLDEIAKLGYDIHITEFDVDIDGQPVRGGFKSGVWDEQTQAEYYELFYRTAFSHPRVKAITTWSFLDRESTGENCGLIRADLTPKPVYNTLQRLINKEWRTEIETKTDGNGMVRLRGFYGTYDVTLIVNGEKRVGSFHLDEEGPREIELVLAKPQLKLSETSTGTRFTESGQIETSSISDRTIVAGAIILIIAAGATLAFKSKQRLMQTKKPSTKLRPMKRAENW